MANYGARDHLKRTPPQWSLAKVPIPGYDRDQLMSAHMSNHVTIGYGDILRGLVATCMSLGIPTRIAGQARDGFQ
jgi:hypothetical protein